MVKDSHPLPPLPTRRVVMNMYQPKPTIYLASSFRYANALTRVAEIIEHLGYSVADVWWHRDSKQNLPTEPAAFYTSSEVMAIERRHWSAIAACEVFVMVADLDAETKLTGASVEYGYARALNKPCIIVGRVKNSAMWAGAIHCSSWDEFYATLDTLNYRRARS